MNNEYTIEKGIAIPAIITRRGLFWVELAAKMNHGDSVLVKTRAEAHCLGLNIKKNKGCSYTSRAISGGKKGYRVWKIVKGLPLGSERQQWDFAKGGK